MQGNYENEEFLKTETFNVNFGRHGRWLGHAIHR